jgi:ribose 5-phosphate isomerase A
VETLGRFPLPIEVLEIAKQFVLSELTRLGGNPVERAGFITDNGNPILDVHGLSITDPVRLEHTLNAIPGIVCNGLFAIRPADVLLLATAQGIQTHTRN